MFSSLSLSSLAESLTDLTQHVSTSVSSTVNSIIEDNRRAFEQEQHKIEEKRKHDEQQQQQAAGRAAQRVPPWHCYTEESQILQAELQQRVQRLAADPRTFLTSSSNDYPFNVDECSPYAECALLCDAVLSRQRYRLVPRKVKEEQFWKNYFTRVEEIRQQMQVGTLIRKPTEAETQAAATTLLPVAQPITQQQIAQMQTDKQDGEQEQKPPTASSSSTAEPPPRSPKPSSLPSSASSPTRIAPVTTTPGSHNTLNSTPIDEHEPEFISDDYVNVASQDGNRHSKHIDESAAVNIGRTRFMCNTVLCLCVSLCAAVLMGQMKAELGIAQLTSSSSTSASSLPVKTVNAVPTKSSRPNVEPDLDELESMLADVSASDQLISTAEGGEDLLSELEGLAEQKGLP